MIYVKVSKSHLFVRHTQKVVIAPKTTPSIVRAYPCTIETRRNRKKNDSLNERAKTSNLNNDI